MADDNATVWTHDEYHWWYPLTCDGLFLVFDTSTYLNAGELDVSADEVIEHVKECGGCQDADIRVSIDTDGKATLENLS